MAGHRRINVASGRPLEKLAHYSRAVRVGDMVLQSGTTAIDRQGNVRGVGDVAAQVDAIMTIAEWSMGKAGGRLDDVVRSRIYVTDIAVAAAAARALARYFRDVAPGRHAGAGQPPGPSGAARRDRIRRGRRRRASARRISSGRAIEDEYAYSRAVRVGDRVFISGTTALSAGGQVDGPGDMYRQTRARWTRSSRRWRRPAACPRDIVYTKTFVTDLARRRGLHARVARGAGRRAARVHAARHPGARAPRSMLIEIEAEAIIGARGARRDIYYRAQREKPRGYARAVAVGRLPSM